MKLEITESQADQMAAWRREMFPDASKAPVAPPLEWIQRAARLVGVEKMDKAWGCEADGEKIEVVVVPNPRPRAEPKLSESMRKRLEAEGKL